MAVAFCSIMLNMGGIEVVSTGETHASHQERLHHCKLHFRKEVARLWKHEGKKSPKKLFVDYGRVLIKKPVCRGAAILWLVPGTKSSVFWVKMTQWFYLLVFIWWLCCMPLVWTWGSCNYWDCFYSMEILWLKAVAVSMGFLWVFYMVTVKLHFWLKIFCGDV